MKLSLLTLTLIPTIFAAPLDAPNEPNNSITPMNIDFGLDEATKIETLQIIANLTNSLIANVEEFADLTNFSLEDLISYPCTRGPDKKEKRERKLSWGAVARATEQQIEIASLFLRVLLGNDKPSDLEMGPDDSPVYS